MNIIECGYCKLDVDINDRHPEYLRSKGISIPLYLHRSCASKINNLGENVWQFHKLSATYIKKQNTTAKLFQKGNNEYRGNQMGYGNIKDCVTSQRL